VNGFAGSMFGKQRIGEMKIPAEIKKWNAPFSAEQVGKLPVQVSQAPQVKAQISPNAGRRQRQFPKQLRQLSRARMAVTTLYS